MAGVKTLWSTALTQACSTDVEGVGRIRWEDDKAYRFVENTVTNADLGANAVVCHEFASGSLSLTKVIAPATAQLGFMAGVLMTTLYSSTGTNPNRYGWVQVYGLNVSVAVTPVNTQTTANPVAGNALIAVNGATYASTGQAMGTAPIYTRRLLLLDSVTAGTAVVTAKVLVQCL